MKRSSATDTRKRADRRTQTGMSWLLSVSALSLNLHFFGSRHRCWNAEAVAFQHWCLDPAQLHLLKKVELGRRRGATILARKFLCPVDSTWFSACSWVVFHDHATYKHTPPFSSITSWHTAAWANKHMHRLPAKTRVPDWCCFYYSIKNSPVALPEALFARSSAVFLKTGIPELVSFSFDEVNQHASSS